MAVQDVDAGEIGPEGLAILFQEILNNPNVTAEVAGQPARFVSRRTGAGLDVAVAGWGEIFGRFKVTIEQVG